MRLSRARREVVKNFTRLENYFNRNNVERLWEEMQGEGKTTWMVIRRRAAARVSSPVASSP